MVGLSEGSQNCRIEEATIFIDMPQSGQADWRSPVIHINYEVARSAMFLFNDSVQLLC